MVSKQLQRAITALRARARGANCNAVKSFDEDDLTLHLTRTRLLHCFGTGHEKQLPEKVAGKAITAQQSSTALEAHVEEEKVPDPLTNGTLVEAPASIRGTLQTRHACMGTYFTTRQCDPRVFGAFSG